MDKKSLKLVPAAVKELKKGGIVIFPTDTAYGMGCLLDQRKSIDRLYRIRKRPPDQAMPVLVSGLDMANEYFDRPDNIVRHLMEKYWPGALTIIYKCKKNIHPSVSGYSDKIGLRMPDYPLILEIIKKVRTPLLGPSANFHGAATPYSFSDLNPELTGLVDYVINGQCYGKQASTVVKVIDDKIEIIRQGAVKVEG